jgi:hypothetical protein
MEVSWRKLVVRSTKSKRQVPPAVRHRVLQHWAEHGGEAPNGYEVICPAGANVINMAGFWPGDER